MVRFGPEVDFDLVNQYVKDGFISCRKHPTADLRIYNYTPKTQYENFWNKETANCRGLIVDGNDRIVARGFQKFFNYEELNGEVPIEPFRVYEKLDGSLGILYWLNDEPFIATRGSFESDMAQRANNILRRKYPNLEPNPEFSHLFEIIYKDNRIVVDYGNTEDLFLLAVVHTESGREMPLPQSPFPTPKIYDGIKDISEIKQYENDQDEGFVIRFESGFRCKVKFAEYKRLHKILTQCSSKSIWECLKTGTPLDEILERVPDEFYKWVRNTRDNLERSYLDIELGAKSEFRDLGDRKANAFYYKACKTHPAILFNMLDGKDYSDIIWKSIKPKFEKPFREDEG